MSRRAPAAWRPARRIGPRRFTKPQITAAIREWARIYGDVPATADWEPSRARRSGQEWRARRFEQGAWPSTSMVRRQFGTLSAAIEAAGCSPRPGPSRTRARLLGSSSILEAIREWSRRYGSPPTMADWEPARARRNGQDWRIRRYERGDWPSARSVRRHFGSFSAGIEAAGLNPRAIGHRGLLAATEESHRASVESRRAASRTGLGAAELARCVKSVAAAQLAADHDALGDALLDVAATALRWADHLVITRPHIP